ncbi:MAG: hypothetical protein ACI8W8_000765 [Rhodothermales bacterium]|jgi:hypothetical protein
MVRDMIGAGSDYGIAQTIGLGTVCFTCRDCVRRWQCTMVGALGQELE